MRLSDYVIQFLADKEVSSIFTVSGGGAIFLFDALQRQNNISYVCCHHEQAASIAAESYARVKNDLGVSIVTSGPGGTNCVTGVAGAWLDHVPHLTISGQTFLSQTIIKNPGLRTLGVQEINIVDIVRPITKYAVMVADKEEIKYHLEKAYHLSKNGRPGPVWIDIPADIQSSEIDPNNLLGFSIDEDQLKAGLINPNFTRQIDELITLLKTSKRPLIHVGQGVRISGAIKDFFDFIEELKIPFVTARNANDIAPTSHSLNIGRPGTYAQRGANFAVQTADLYIAIGTRLSLAQTGYNTKDYARNAKIVMIDIDQAELDKDTVTIDLKIKADAKILLSHLNKRISDILKSRKTLHWDNWLQQCQEWREMYPVVLPEYASQKGSVNSYYFIDRLSRVAGKEDIVVTDMGFAFQNTHQAFSIRHSQRLFTNSGLAAMGWGLPAAVGAAFARNAGQNIICISGEGGLMMNIQELATVMHHKLPVKLFVLNNGGYLTIKQTQELGFEGRLMGCNEGSGIAFPLFSKIAQAHNIDYVKIKTHKNLDQKLLDVMQIKGPVLCEIIMDPNQIQAPKLIGRKDSSGKNLPAKIEDAHPFLDEDEIISIFSKYV